MTVVWEETRDSPILKGKSLERKYVGTGTDDAGVARYQLLLQSPAVDGAMIRDDAVVQPHEDSTEIWDGTVTYTLATDPQSGGLLPPTFRFSTSGGKSKMTVGLEVTGAYAASGYTAAKDDDGGLIGVTSEGVEGVDVDVPGFSWQETWRLAPQKLTWNYAKFVRDISATTNKQKFRAFAPGEVLFLFADGGSQGTSEDFREVTFHFASNPNRTNLKVGSITGIVKKGWWYLDVRYRTDVIGQGKDRRTTKKPIRAYTHRVFEESNFSQLGIGS